MYNLLAKIRDREMPPLIVSGARSDCSNLAIIYTRKFKSSYNLYQHCRFKDLSDSQARKAQANNEIIFRSIASFSLP